MINGLMVYMIQQRMENYLINMDIIIHIESLYLGSKYLPRVLVIGLMILLVKSKFVCKLLLGTCGARGCSASLS